MESSFRTLYVLPLLCLSLPVNSCSVRFARWQMMVFGKMICKFSGRNYKLSSLSNTHTFNGPLSRTTWLSRCQKGKPTCILLKQETVSGSCISWAICKSAPRSRQITMPAPHHLVFYRLDGLPVTQPTASKHWRREHWRHSVNRNKYPQHRCGLLLQME